MTPLRRTLFAVAALLVLSTWSVPARAQCCVASSGCFCDLGNGTIKDTCTGRQWEKKTTAVGSGVNPADRHDVDNLYSWAGRCTVGGALCQPNFAALLSCLAHSDGTGCGTCVSGTCNVDPFGLGAITTVWDWLNGVNAANFAGHNDWRLPSEGGHNSPATGSNELETILLAPYPCGTTPCINSLFGPTASYWYWSASTKAPTPVTAWFVYFGNGFVGYDFKTYHYYVRAVR